LLAFNSFWNVNLGNDYAARQRFSAEKTAAPNAILAFALNHCFRPGTVRA